jgi:murein DD-endopeptidase MepM/ murein hydrolase activator NlpD
VTARLSAALAFACLGLLLGGGAAAAPPSALAPPATAQGFAVAVIGPDGSSLAGTAGISAPPASASSPTSFAYPADGSIVSADSTAATVSASQVDGTAAASVKVTDLSLFGGEITASEVRTSVSSAGTIGSLSDSTITNLIVFGQSVSEPAPNLQLSLGDWGSLTVLSESTSQGDQSAPFWRGTVMGLSVHLDADHLGFPRGSTIHVGFADAYARSPGPATTTTTGQATTPKASNRNSLRPKSKSKSKSGRKARPSPFAAGAAIGVRAAADTHRTTKSGGLPIRTDIPDVTPKLTAGGYVFPVYGPSAYGDTFGAPRGDVSGGWHHGDDIFAPLGAPILAVANGTVFSVGWNDIGGYRLWLRDRGGNEFYYAHLSAYTNLAVNGRHVKAGDVLGFVGNTGDAATTPFHLHFEVHPVSLLFLGDDGAVNPTRYLNAWKRLEDIRILPAVPFATPAAGVSSAPTPGAILLESSDISTANGLEPDSLSRAMNATKPLDVTAPRVAELPVPLPVLDRA